MYLRMYNYDKNTVVLVWGVECCLHDAMSMVMLAINGALQIWDSSGELEVVPIKTHKERF